LPKRSPPTAVGFLLHPVDLAVNKTLALAGRDEPRGEPSSTLERSPIRFLTSAAPAACCPTSPMRDPDPRLASRRGFYSCSINSPGAACGLPQGTHNLRTTLDQ
jgi:hypothetical protein